MEQYQKEYNQFIADYQKGATTAEEIGILVSHLAQFFSEKNIVLSSSEWRLNQRGAELASSIDQESGKPISIAKADILIKATEEWQHADIIKKDLQNIEQMINALKYLQKGMLNEYSHMANS